MTPTPYRRERYKEFGLVFFAFVLEFDEELERKPLQPSLGLARQLPKWILRKENTGRVVVVLRASKRRCPRLQQARTPNTPILILELFCSLPGGGRM